MVPQIVLCPKCHQPTASPKKGGPKSVVRCPLCKKEFKLRDAREFRPPKLMMISGAVDVGAPVSDERPGLADELPGFADELPPLVDQPAVAEVPEASEAIEALPALSSEPELPPSVEDIRSSRWKMTPEPEPVPATKAESSIDDWLPPAAVTAPPPVAPAPGGVPVEKPEPLAFDESEFVATPRARRAAANPLREMVKIVLGGIAGLCVGYAILIWGFRVDPFGLTRMLPRAILPAALQER